MTEWWQFVDAYWASSRGRDMKLASVIAGIMLLLFFAVVWKIEDYLEDKEYRKRNPQEKKL